MFQIALYEPEIPPNTGNIICLCANTGCKLHLIHPLGFSMETKQLRRAGLDYRDLMHVVEHESWDHFAKTHKDSRILAFSTKAKGFYTDISYEDNDILLFGPETRGLPEHIRMSIGTDNILRLPMQASSRSLNLSNAVAIVTYEAWKHIGFKGSI